MEIIINNSISLVKGSNSSIDKKLVDALAYKDGQTEYAYHLNKVKMEHYLTSMETTNDPSEKLKFRKLYSLEKSKEAYLKKCYYRSLYVEGEFPTGLLYLVEQTFKDNNYYYTITDNRRKPVKQTFKFVNKESFPPLRYYQKEAIQAFLKAERGVIEAATGTGKTTIISKIIWELNVKTLIITPSKSITDMMVTTLTRFFGKSNVARLNSKSIKTKPINVINIQALAKLKKGSLDDIDLVVVDEAHHQAADTYQFVNKELLQNCYYRLCVSATFFRNSGDDMEMLGFTSNVVYEYPATRAIKDGFLVKPKILFIQNEVSCLSTYRDEYKFGIVENKSRNLDVQAAVEQNKGKQIIVLVREIAHGELLKSMIPNSDFVSGNENDSDREKMLENFRSKKTNILIGTSCIGEGVDLPCAEVLIMAAGGKAKSQVMQNVGRVLRPYEGKTEALVYDFCDNGGNFLERHSRLREEVYVEQYGECQE
jgi:superfamily II DNA or RNA helicase